MTGIEIQLRFFMLSFFLFLCKPVITINGAVYRKSWGTHFIELPPGRYVVKVHFHYLFWHECGANAVEARVDAGNVTRVSYYMPSWMTAKGVMKVTK